MAAYFIDLDGVFFNYGTMIPTDGAVESVRDLWGKGHQVFFTTRRKGEGNNPPELNLKNTKAALESLKVPYSAIVPGVESPRILINDDGAHAINHRRNKPLRIVTDLEAAHAFYSTRSDLRSDSTRDLPQRIYEILACIAWTSWSYVAVNDADDYIQTIQIARSLCACGGFNHRDIVNRYRSRTGISYDGKPLYYGGVDKEYKGQLAKLLASSDPLYFSTDGVSDGSAMKVAGVAAFYSADFTKMVLATDEITKITHCSVESRLAAVLIVLRIQRVLLGESDANLDAFVLQFHDAVALLGFEDRAGFFLSRVERAVEITRNEQTAAGLLIKLAREIGLTHLAWGTPIAACFWSFRADDDIKKWMALCVEESSIVWPVINVDHVYVPVPEGSRLPTISRLVDFHRITGATLRKAVIEQDRKHLIDIGEFDSFVESHGHHWNKGIDSDTFFSIAFSILAAKFGIEKIADEVPQAMAAFGDDLRGLAHQLADGSKFHPADSEHPAMDEGNLPNRGAS